MHYYQANKYVLNKCVKQSALIISALISLDATTLLAVLVGLKRMVAPDLDRWGKQSAQYCVENLVSYISSKYCQ